MIKNRLLIHFSITAKLYVIVCLMVSFIMWKVKNPFLWILKIPEYDDVVRLNILFWFFVYHFILSIYISEKLKKKGGSNE